MKAAACPPLEPTLIERHCRVGGGRDGIGVERGDRRGAVQCVAVGGAVILDGGVDDPYAGSLKPYPPAGRHWKAYCRMREQCPAGRPARASGRMAIRLPPAVTQIGEQGHLRIAERHACEHDHIVSVQQG